MLAKKAGMGCSKMTQNNLFKKAHLVHCSHRVRTALYCHLANNYNALEAKCPQYV